ncbi:hypothetical protein FGO68_gene16628 [Halteria grandinella]|uniref:Uncharacterized protein n=1 Tax=Halteria grandinella TaxID=5974 RepID=A0A8J8P4Q2_HALGN|nr:hypothetical protein FGO68_gene16628 [Halteria grandinella]
MPSKAPAPTLYSILCKIYDTGIPYKTTTTAILINVLLYNPDNLKNLLILAPYISNFTEYGEITIQMGQPFSKDLEAIDINSLLNITVGTNAEIQRGFKWECETIMESSFVIKITFNDVYSLTEKDFVSIAFLNPELFYNSDNSTTQMKVKLDKNFKIKKFVPEQKAREDNSQFKQLGDSASLGLKSILYANFGMNMVMAASMQLLWSLINSLQLLVRTPLMNLNFPSQIKVFFNSFVMVTNFDILPSQELNELLFKFDHIEYEERFSEMGYDSQNAVDNIGSFIYYFILILGIVSLSGFMKLFASAFGLIRYDVFDKICFQTQSSVRKSPRQSSVEFHPPPMLRNITRLNTQLFNQDQSRKFSSAINYYRVIKVKRSKKKLTGLYLSHSFQWWEQ